MTACMPSSRKYSAMAHPVYSAQNCNGVSPDTVAATTVVYLFFLRISKKELLSNGNVETTEMRLRVGSLVDGLLILNRGFFYLPLSNNQLPLTTPNKDYAVNCLWRSSEIQRANAGAACGTSLDNRTRPRCRQYHPRYQQASRRHQPHD